MPTRREFLSLALAFPVAALGGLARAQSGSKPLASEWGPTTIRALEFSPDGRKLAAVGNVIRVWDLGAAARARRLPGDNWDADQVAFLRDGRSLICGDMNGFLWRVDLGTESRFGGPASARRFCRWPPLRMAARSSAGSTSICSSAARRAVGSSESSGRKRLFRPILRSRRTASGSRRSAATTRANSSSGTSHRAPWRGDFLLPTPATPSPLRAIRAPYPGSRARRKSWESPPAELAGGAIETKPFHLPEAFADASGTALAGDRLVSAAEGAAVIWDLVKDAPVWSIETETDNEARAFGLSHDGKTVAFAEPDGSATLRDVATGASLRKLVY